MAKCPAPATWSQRARPAYTGVPDVGPEYAWHVPGMCHYGATFD